MINSSFNPQKTILKVTLIDFWVKSEYLDICFFMKFAKLRHKSALNLKIWLMGWLQDRAHNHEYDTHVLDHHGGHLVRRRWQCFVSGSSSAGIAGSLYTAFAQPGRRRFVGNRVFAFIARGFRVRLGAPQLVFNAAFGLGLLFSVGQSRVMASRP
jgi:hypothetical protein